MRSILLKTILSIPLIVLKIIIIVFEGMKSIIERIGGFFLLLFKKKAVFQENTHYFTKILRNILSGPQILICLQKIPMV